MAHSRMKPSKVSKLFRKWTCFSGMPSVQEIEEQNNLKINQPKIVITECKSLGSSPNFSRRSSSSSSASYDETDAEEIDIKTDDTTHSMGMSIVVKKRRDAVDGGSDDVAIISVNDVMLGSFAHGFGIRKGDVVRRINGSKYSNITEIKEAFASVESNSLEMEILRAGKNTTTGQREVTRMIISNERRIEGTIENELEIIAMRSSWSLSDLNEGFAYAEKRQIYLRFANEDMPWVVCAPGSNRLSLEAHLPKDEEMLARFCVREYYSFFSTTAIPVVLQHVQSKLCIALEGNSITLVEPSNDLEDIMTNKDFLFYMHTEQVAQDNMNMTFQSIADDTLYLGFDLHGYADGYASPINAQASGSIVFIVMDPE